MFQIKGGARGGTVTNFLSNVMKIPLSPTHKGVDYIVISSLLP